MDVSELTVGAEDSGALPRIVGPAKDFVRGSINNRPFRPGGLDKTDSLEKILPDGACNGEWALELLHGGPAQVIPPGFRDGLDLGQLEVMLLNPIMKDPVSVNALNFLFLSILQ